MESEIQNDARMRPMDYADVADTEGEVRWTERRFLLDEEMQVEVVARQRRGEWKFFLEEPGNAISQPMEPTPELVRHAEALLNDGGPRPRVLGGLPSDDGGGCEAVSA